MTRSLVKSVTETPRVTRTMASTVGAIAAAVCICSLKQWPHHLKRSKTLGNNLASPRTLSFCRRMLVPRAVMIAGALKTLMVAPRTLRTVRVAPRTSRTVRVAAAVRGRNWSCHTCRPPLAH